MKPPMDYLGFVRLFICLISVVTTTHAFWGINPNDQDQVRLDMPETQKVIYPERSFTMFGESVKSFVIMSHGRIQVETDNDTYNISVFYSSVPAMGFVSVEVVTNHTELQRTQTIVHASTNDMDFVANWTLIVTWYDFKFQTNGSFSQANLTFQGFLSADYEHNCQYLLVAYQLNNFDIESFDYGISDSKGEKIYSHFEHVRVSALSSFITNVPGSGNWAVKLDGQKRKTNTIFPEAQHPTIFPYVGITPLLYFDEDGHFETSVQPPPESLHTMFGHVISNFTMDANGTIRINTNSGHDFEFLLFHNDHVPIKFGRLHFGAIRDFVKVRDRIRELTGDSDFKADWSLIATWGEIVYKNFSSKIYTFQGVITFDEHQNRVYIIAAYKTIPEASITFETAFVKDENETMYALPGHSTPDVFKLANTSNVGAPGVWVFHPDNEIEKIQYLIIGTEIILPESVQQDQNGKLWGEAKVISEIKCVLNKMVNGTYNGTLACTNSNQTTVGTDIHHAFLGRQIHCSCYAESCQYCDMDNVTINVAYGPRKIIPTVTNNGQYHICPGTTQDNITVHCDVPVDDVNPKPNVVLTGVTDIDLRPSNITIEEHMYRYSFSFLPQTLGNLEATCVSNNSVIPMISVENGTTIVISGTKPTIWVSDILYDLEGRTWISEGSSTEVTCRLDETANGIENAVLECNGTKHTAQGIEMTTELSAIWGTQEIPCTCYAENVPECNQDNATIKVAYGPSKVSMTSSNPSTFNLCPDKSRSISLSCDVDIEAVYPSALVRLQGVTDNDVFPTDSEEVENVYRFHFLFTALTGDTLNITCVALNYHYSTLKATDQMTIDIFEPPSEAPTVRVNRGSPIPNNFMYNVSLGQMIDVDCTVDGGHPSISEVTLECAGLTESTSSDVTTVNFVTDKDMIQRTCKCQAEHISGCYDETTQFTINVMYPSNVTTFTINSDGENLEVDAGQSLDFLCQAEGNPIPEVSIGRVLSNTKLNGQISLLDPLVRQFETKEVMTCGHSDVYRCVSDNGDQSERNITVLVKCPPEVVRQEIVITKSGEIHITADILGHPAPTKFELIKHKKQSERVRRSSGEDIIRVFDASEFLVKFEQINLKYGRVTVDSFDREIDENSFYSLSIGNGLGSALSLEYNTTLNQVATNPEDSRGTVGDILNILVVGIVAGMAMVLLTALTIFYVRWMKSVRRRQQMRLSDILPHRRHNMRLNTRSPNVFSPKIQGRFQSRPRMWF